MTQAPAQSAAVKALHVGGVGWNAYLNAKLMGERGDLCHVAANDIYHCVCCPEWHEADDGTFTRAELGDDFFPNFFRFAACRALRPRWFAQGPQLLVITYLYFLVSGDGAIAEGLWRALDYARFRAVLARTTAPEGVRLDRDAFEAALERLQVAEAYQADLRAAFEADQLTVRFAETAARLQGVEDPAALRPPFASAYIDWVCAQDAATARAVVEARADGRALSTGFELPDWRALSPAAAAGPPPHRRGLARPEDAALYASVVEAWSALFSRYDRRVLYGAAPILGLLSSAPDYLAYEHGTIRTAPFEDTAYGRLLRAAYEAADGVFVTNGDYVTAERRVEFEPGRLTYLPHAFDEKPLLAFARAHRPARLPAKPIRFFAPARHDWVRGNERSKANDRIIEAAARLVRHGRADFEVTFVNWGPDCAASRERIEALGVGERFIWVDPMPRHALWRRYLQSHAAMDQFVLSSLSGVSYEALTLGVRTITHDNGVSNAVFFGEAPPLLAAQTGEEIAERMGEVLADPNDAAGIGAASTAWMCAWHSGARLLALEDGAFARLDAVRL